MFPRVAGLLSDPLKMTPIGRPLRVILLKPVVFRLNTHFAYSNLLLHRRPRLLNICEVAGAGVKGKRLGTQIEHRFVGKVPVAVANQTPIDLGRKPTY